MGGLVAAAMLSGMGQGAQQGMQTAAQAWLLDQRNKAEMERTQFIEQQLSRRHADTLDAEQERTNTTEAGATARHESTLKSQEANLGQQITSNEAIAQQNRDQAKALHESDQTFKGQENDKQRDFEAGQLQTKIGADIGLQGLRQSYVSPLEKKQVEALNDKLQEDRTVRKLRDAYVASLGGKDIEKTKIAEQQYLAATGKLMDANKTDLISATAGLKDSTNEILRLSTQLKEQIPGSAEHSLIMTQLNEAIASHKAYDARVKDLGGAKMPAPASDPVRAKIQAGAQELYGTPTPRASTAKPNLPQVGSNPTTPTPDDIRQFQAEYDAENKPGGHVSDVLKDFRDKFGRLPTEEDYGRVNAARGLKSAADQR